MFLYLLLIHVRILVASDVDEKVAVKATRLAIVDIEKATHVRLKVTSIETFEALPWEAPFPGALEPWTNMYYRLKRELFDPVAHKRAIFIFAVRPQRNLLNQPYYYGVAQGVCLKPPAMLYVTTADAPSSFVSTQISRYVLEHELLHLLGATHKLGRNVMAPGNNIYVWSLFPFLSIYSSTVKEVTACEKTSFKETSGRTKSSAGREARNKRRD